MRQKKQRVMFYVGQFVQCTLRAFWLVLCIPRSDDAPACQVALPNARGACLLPATNCNADSIASSVLTQFVSGKAKSRPAKFPVCWPDVLSASKWGCANSGAPPDGLVDFELHLDIWDVPLCGLLMRTWRRVPHCCVHLRGTTPSGRRCPLHLPMLATWASCALPPV